MGGGVGGVVRAVIDCFMFAAGKRPLMAVWPGSAASAATMVKTFQAYLPHCHRTYSCIHCRAHLANHDELISKVAMPDSSL